MSQKNQTKIFKIIGLLLILSQTLFDTLNVLQLSNESKMIIGAIAMFTAVANAGFKQYFDKSMSNQTVWIQVLFFVAFVCGGVMQEMGKLDFLGTDIQSQLRMALTFITMAVPVVVKQMNSQVVNNERWVQK